MLVSSIYTWVLVFRFYATNVHLRRIFVCTPSVHHYLIALRIKLLQFVSSKRLKIVYPEESFGQFSEELLFVVHAVSFFYTTIDMFDALILSGCLGSIVCIFERLIVITKLLVMPGMGKLV